MMRTDDDNCSVDGQSLVAIGSVVELRSLGIRILLRARVYFSVDRSEVFYTRMIDGVIVMQVLGSPVR